MIVRNRGGLTEFIPSPQEKRDGLIRDHVLDLLFQLHQRLTRIEAHLDLPPKEAEAWNRRWAMIQREEEHLQSVHRELQKTDLNLQRNQP